MDDVRLFRPYVVPYGNRSGVSRRSFGDLLIDFAARRVICPCLLPACWFIHPSLLLLTKSSESSDKMPSKTDGIWLIERIARSLVQMPKASNSNWFKERRIVIYRIDPFSSGLKRTVKKSSPSRPPPKEETFGPLAPLLLRLGA